MDDVVHSVAPHANTSAEVLEALGSSDAGLTNAEATERLARFGPNRLPIARTQGPLLRFLLQFHNVLIYVLLGSALITAGLRHWIDTGVILAVVVINAVLGFIQEGKAEKAMVAVRKMLAPTAAVLRDGHRQTLPAEDLVPGDIVWLEPGDRVPADLRLVRAHGLRIQEAVLTGESVPVEKQVHSVALDAALGDRACMAFSGTQVAAGQGYGVVVATGGHSEIGRISHLLREVESLVTPLTRQMGLFARWLTGIILLVALMMMLFGYFVRGHAFDELFMAVVGLSVAAIPEGLPAVLTVTLAIGVQAMARRNAIVRRLPAIETVGAVSVICTDKTGTLTCNEMMVASLSTTGHEVKLEGAGYTPSGRVLEAGQPASPSTLSRLHELARCAVLCNDAQLLEAEGDWVIEGDPMEAALLVMARKLGVHEPDVRQHWTRTDAIPFDARHRLMATLNHNHEQHAGIFVKGAPEAVLHQCQWQYGDDGQPEPLDEPYWRDRYEIIAAQGQRVLALAERRVPADTTVLEFDDLKGELTLLGLVGMQDPPRPEAVDAVAQCLRAGIAVKMITGDHAGTAQAIAREVGLAYPDQVLTGRDLDQMDDDALAAAVLNTDVFARTSPEHKLRLVQALQAHNLIVAMTGDGVNDAPALKRADTGIAMGMRGSEAAKEAADLVLADDNFASIVAAIREGRTVYENLKKVIGWTLPTSSGEAMTIIVAVLFGWTLPVTPVQILWVNLITATTLGLALAFEPTTNRAMDKPPRARDEPLLSGVLTWHIALVSALFLLGVYAIFSHALAQGYSLELARTMALNTLVVMEIFQLFFMRNFHNTHLRWRDMLGTPAVWIAVGLVTAAQFIITYTPGLERIFGTRPVPFFDGMLIVLTGVALFLIIEIEKQVRLRWFHGHANPAHRHEKQNPTSP